MSPFVIPILALLIPIIIVPTALGLKHARFLREVEHAERMRALELGRSLAEDRGCSRLDVAMAIGAGVPVGSLGVVWLAGQASPLLAQPLSVAAGFIGLGAVLCGTILAATRPTNRDQAAPASRSDEKFAMDPDAYDVVGSRG